MFGGSLVRYVALMVAVLSMGCAARGRSPAVEPAALVGVWARQGEKVPTLVLRADGTSTTFGKGSVNLAGPAPIQSDGYWRLAGDTLMLGPEPKPATATALVKLADRRLIVTGFHQGAEPRVYERLESPEP